MALFFYQFTPLYGHNPKKRLLSVNSHHNGQKFTDKSPENIGLSVKCVLLTDKSAKIGSLSVNLSEILADCPKNKKYVPSQHVFLSLFSCVRAHKRSASHLVLSSFILTKSFVKMPATFFSINSFASFSSSIVQMR